MFRTKTKILPICTMMLLFLATGFLLNSTQVHAEFIDWDYELEQLSVDYSKSIGICGNENYYVKMGKRLENSAAINVKSSDENMVSAELVKKGSKKNTIHLRRVNNGTAVITITVQYKNGNTSEYPINVTSYKHIRPIKKYKIGKYKLGFKESNLSTYIIPEGSKKVLQKGKISITPQSGWKLKKITQKKYGKNKKRKKIKNKSKITIKNYQQIITATFYNAEKNLWYPLYYTIETPEEE